MNRHAKARAIGLAGWLASAFLAGGCATVAPTAQPTAEPPRAFSAGRAIEDFPRKPNVVSTAVADALLDLKMTSIKNARDGAVYKIEARTTDNRSVLVTVRPHQDQSRVGCRVGWFGDEPLSKAIIERIGIRLELLPPAPIPENPPSSPAPNPFLLRDAALKDGMIRDMVEAPYRDRVSPL